MFIDYKINGFDWSEFRKLAEELYEKGWFIDISNGDLSFIDKVVWEASNITELLDKTEEYLKKEYNIDKKDIPYHIHIILRPPFFDPDDIIEIRYGKEAWTTPDLKEKLEFFLEKIKAKKVIEK